MFAEEKDKIFAEKIIAILFCVINKNNKMPNSSIILEEREKLRKHCERTIDDFLIDVSAFDNYIYNTKNVLDCLQFSYQDFNHNKSTTMRAYMKDKILFMSGDLLTDISLVINNMKKLAPNLYDLLYLSFEDDIYDYKFPRKNGNIWKD